MYRFQYILYRICVNVIGIGFASLIMESINVKSYGALLAAALILTFFQTFLRPLLFFLTLPFQILSLGVGYMIINSMLLLLTAHFIEELVIKGFWAAFLGAIIISIVNLVFDSFSSRSAVKFYYRKGE
ncbi:phage holin family protein [Seleniivibrio sp.]|uniref:phage holin family protein n=1 Tax=Seleniivibrio sp. TaxID=2898801 RepID=UPI0025D3EA9A|nr:phage holin family protein [Seleniivibrio sp.]MCD8552983.1 phage holin family protein [Seleniivibrio sp.]